MNEQSLHRGHQIARLRGEHFDLAVIGGGINGAAIARQAALSGLRVALVEGADFAAATSSQSSKLIHGGLRYLPQLQLRLVYQALAERERLRRLTAPHLVHPLRFLFPIYAGRPPSRLALGVGLFLYDLMARTRREQRHQRLDASEVIQLEPMLSRNGLSGGALYFDARGDDARLTLENVLDAALHGAAVANYCEVTELERSGSTLSGVWVRDSGSGAPFLLRARWIVNATGPWVDRLRRMDEPGAPPLVRLTKGVHLVFERSRLPVGSALVLSDNAGRIVFVIPEDEHVLVGTTDTDFEGDPGAAGVQMTDIAYLLGLLNSFLPRLNLGQDDVIFGFAGLRALIRDDLERRGDAGRRLSPSAVSREAVIVESASGLLTVAGGKLTTHRALAEQVVGSILKRQGQATGHPRLSPDLPLPGARPLPESALLASPPLPGFVRARYGTRAALVKQIAAANPKLAVALVPGCRAVGAEVIMTARYEMVLGVEDFLIRRTGLSWRQPETAIAAAGVVAHLLGEEMGWSAATIREETERTQQRLRGWRQRDPIAAASDQQGA